MIGKTLLQTRNILVSLWLSVIALNFLGYLFAENAFFRFWELLAPDGHIERKDIFVLGRLLPFFLSLFFVTFALTTAQYLAYLKKFSRDRIYTMGYFAVLTLIGIHLSHAAVSFSSGGRYIDGWLEEDGILENMTVLLSFCAGLLFLYSTRMSTDAVTRALLIGYTIFFIVFATEEISWGQRIIGWKTPTLYEKVNVQSETNLHNLINRNMLRFTITTFNLILSLLLFKAAAVFQFLRGGRSAPSSTFRNSHT